MNNLKPKRHIDFYEANRFDNWEMARPEKKPSKVKQIEQKFTREQTAENELAHEQNISAHISGASAIAELD